MIAHGQFTESFRWKLESFGEGLADDLGQVRALGDDTAGRVFDFLTDSAFRAQGMPALAAGRTGLAWMPRHWMLAQLEARFVPVGEYEWRRLLEFCSWLATRGDEQARSTTRRLATRAGTDADSEVREVGLDYLTWLDARPAFAMEATA